MPLLCEQWGGRVRRSADNHWEPYKMVGLDAGGVEDIAEPSVLGVFLLKPLALERIQILVRPPVEVALDYSDHRRWRCRGAGVVSIVCIAAIVPCPAGAFRSR